MPEFYVIITRKINYIFKNFIGEGHVGCPPYPTPMIARTSIYSPGTGKIRGGPFGIAENSKKN